MPVACTAARASAIEWAMAVARDAIRFLDVRDLPAGALHQLHVDLPDGMLETDQKGILSLLILGGHDDE